MTNDECDGCRIGRARFFEQEGTEETENENGLSVTSVASCSILDELVGVVQFARKYETLKGRTSATASGLSDDVWTIKELVERAAWAQYSEGARA
jgi:hypothetical protein